MTFNDSNQMNSRKQVSNGYDDTSTGDEQIRPGGILQFQEIVDGTTTGNPVLVQENGWTMRRTEDNTLGMTEG